MRSLNQIHLYTSECMPMLRFFYAVCQTADISHISINLFKSNLPMLSLNCFITTSISSWWDEKCARKWSQQVLLCAGIVTPRQDDSQWNWYKMVEVSDTCKHGRYEKKTKLGEQLVCNGWIQVTKQIHMTLTWTKIFEQKMTTLPIK